MPRIVFVAFRSPVHRRASSLEHSSRAVVEVERSRDSSPQLVPPPAVLSQQEVVKPGAEHAPDFFFWSDHAWMIVVGWNPGRTIPEASAGAFA